MTDKPTVVESLAAVMAAVRSVGKEGWNDQQKFKFRGIDGVLNAVGPALRDHGVVVVPVVQDIKIGTVDVGSGDKRRPIGHVTVTVLYRFYGPAGDFIESVTYGESMDSGDKATAKAMSVAFRTCLLQALALPTSDEDPDATSYERAAREPLPTNGVERVKGNPGPDAWQDPLLALKQKVMAAGKALGYNDKDALASDYAIYSNGLMLADAGDMELQAYLAHLEAEATKAELAAVPL